MGKVCCAACLQELGAVLRSPGTGFCFVFVLARGQLLLPTPQRAEDEPPVPATTAPVGGRWEGRGPPAAVGAPLGMRATTARR